MNTKQSDILSTQTSTESKTNSKSTSSEIISDGNGPLYGNFKLEETQIIEPIPNTPFILIGNQEQGYTITINKYRLIEPKPTKEEALAAIEIEKWNIIANVIIVTNSIIEETKKKSNK